MHLLMLIWLYIVPLGYQRQMHEKDIDYRRQLKILGLLPKQSSAQLNLNGYLENNKCCSLNLPVNENINKGDDVIKNQTIYF
jgi:hypothetical protein